MGCGTSKEPSPPQVKILSARELGAPPYYDKAALKDLDQILHSEKCGQFAPCFLPHDCVKPQSIDSMLPHDCAKSQSIDSMLDLLVRGSPEAVDSAAALVAAADERAMSCEGEGSDSDSVPHALGLLPHQPTAASPPPSPPPTAVDEQRRFGLLRRPRAPLLALREFLADRHFGGQNVS